MVLADSQTLLTILKSSHIAVASISQGYRVLKHPVSCFNKLPAAVTTSPQAEALLMIL